MPEEIKRILILSANPKDTVRLRLSEEVRAIQEGLERSIGREKFQLDYSFATRAKDIRRKMLDYRPHIVHFCGHGEGEQGIIFENDNGNAILISADVLADFFELFQTTLECVVLNACYSKIQANAISKCIKYVIGMNKSIGDKIAIEFSVAFYDAIYANCTYEFAYKLACNAICWFGTSKDFMPVLKKYNILMPIDDDYIETMELVNSGRIEESIPKLQESSIKQNLYAILVLSMIYREGIGINPDSKRARLYLNMALEIPNVFPKDWAELGYQLYDINHPSLEAAAFLTAAIECGYNISGRTCVGAIRIFFKFNYMSAVWHYAEYGANELHDSKCQKIYDMMILNKKHLP